MQILADQFAAVQVLSQWLAVCVPVRALIFAVVCPAVLCGSLPWTDHCFGHHFCSLLAPLSFVDHCFGRLFCQIRVLVFALRCRLA